MIRLLYCLRRRPELALPEFHEHWLDHHVERYGRPIREIRRYVLYTAIEPQPGAVGASPYDGIASVWFDDLASLRETMEGAMPEAGVDEQRFIDHDRSRAMVAEDRVLVEPDEPAPVVLFECLAAADDGDSAGLSPAWLQIEERVREEHVQGLLQGYVQTTVVSDPEGATAQFDRLGDPSEHWEGIGAAYFDSVVVALRYLEHSGGLPSRTAPAIDHARTVGMLARRHPRRDPIR